MLSTALKRTSASLLSRLGAGLSTLYASSPVKDTVYVSSEYNPKHRDLTPEEKLNAIVKSLEESSKKIKERDKSKGRQ